MAALDLEIEEAIGKNAVQRNTVLTLRIEERIGIAGRGFDLDLSQGNIAPCNGELAAQFKTQSAQQPRVRARRAAQLGAPALDLGQAAIHRLGNAGRSHQTFDQIAGDKFDKREQGGIIAGHYQPVLGLDHPFYIDGDIDPFTNGWTAYFRRIDRSSETSIGASQEQIRQKTVDKHQDPRSFPNGKTHANSFNQDVVYSL